MNTRTAPDDNFSSAMKKVFQDARSIAHKSGYVQIGSLHLLAAITRQPDSAATTLLERHYVSQRCADRWVMDRARNVQINTSPEVIALQPAVARALFRAHEDMTQRLMESLDPEHLLFALLEQDCDVVDCLGSTRVGELQRSLGQHLQARSSAQASVRRLSAFRSSRGSVTV